MPQDQNPQPAPEPSTATTPTLRPWSHFVFWLMAAFLAAILAVMLADMPWAGLAYVIPNLLDMVRKPWQFPVHSVLGLAVAAVEIAGLFGVGFGLLCAVRPWRRMLPLLSERSALALPVAAVPFSLLVLTMGLIGQATPRAGGVLLLALFLAGLPGWRFFIQAWRRGGGRAARRRLAELPVWLTALTAVLLALSLLYALTPATESDELRYHLSAPALWLREGRIRYIPYQAFSNFPMLAEMLFMPPLALAGEEAAKPLHLAFLPVCMLLVGLITMRLCPGRTRRLRPPAGLAFAFIPTVIILAAWGWIDVIVTAYFLAFVYLTGRALVRPRRGSGTLIGLIAGGGIATKYTMLGLLGLLGVAWTALLLLARAARRGAPRLACAVALWTVLWGGAWYLKNFAWTGNPFYPYAHTIFGGGEWSPDNTAFFIKKAHTNTGMNYPWASGALGRSGEFLLTPLTATFIPRRYEDNPLGPLPLMALVLALTWAFAHRPLSGNSQATSRNPRFLHWIALAALLAWIGWFFSYQSNRFLLPAAALVLALGGRAAALWLGVLPRFPSRVLRALTSLGFLYVFLYTVAQILAPWRNRDNPDLPNKSDAVAVALGFTDRSDYLARRLNYYNAARWLARRVRPGERVLLVGEHRTMHFSVPVIASDWYDTPQPLPFLRSTRTNDELLERLRAAGARYILFNRAELNLQLPLFRARFASDAEFTRFEQIWDHPRLKQVYPNADKEGIAIFYIQSTP